MSFSLSRLEKLFTSKGFVPNNYFTLDGVYKMVEIINFKNAISLIVVISGKHQIPAEKLKHEYSLLPKKINEDFILGAADEATLRSSYQEIDHISKALEREEKFLQIYDKPISLKGEEERSLEKFASTMRQLKRFRLCVRNIPFKFVIFDDDCMCILNEESEIESYFINEFKGKKRKIFITTSLETFFTSEDIETSVNKISEQFYNILQDNQKTETQKIQGMIDAKRNIAAQSKRILDIKKKFLDKIQVLQKNHSSVTNKIVETRKKKKEFVGVGNGAPSIIAKFDLDIEKYEEQQADIIRDILATRKELDELVLVVDNVLFDNMIMLTRTTNNFKLLERLKG